jgi:hypothetical protein
VKRPLARRRPQSPQLRSTSARKHPLLTAFPLAVMAIGTLLVAFALAMTSLNAGEDSSLHPGKSASPVAISPARTP